MRSLKRAATSANLNDPVLPAARRNFGARPAISVWQRRQEVPELVALGAEVLPVRLGRGNLDRDTLGDVQPVAFQADDLLGVVGQELQVLDPQVDQDLSPDAVIAEIGVESERDVGLDRVLALILQLVRAHLVEEPDPTPLLPHVHEDPRLSAWIRLRALSSWRPQSHRREWKTSPVRHSEWTRTSTGESPDTGPITSASGTRLSTVVS